jgi:hypothetical protein
MNAIFVVILEGAAMHSTVSAPTSATAGTAFNFTVTALDAYNNTATGYTGTLRFTSTDALAVLPANSTLTNGTGTFSATLKTAGNQTIAATDTSNSSITGTSGTISVSAASVTDTAGTPQSALSAPPSPTQSTNVGVTLNAPAPATTPLDGMLVLTCQPDARTGTPSGYCDPATQFASGGTTICFTIPAGITVATFNNCKGTPGSGALNVGTTAGTITATLKSLVAGSTNVLPASPPSESVPVSRSAPVITSASITDRSPTSFSVQVVGDSTPRDLANVTFTFQPAAGATLNGTSFPFPLESTAASYFSSAQGLDIGGGNFELTEQFTFSGDTNALGSVTVTLSNSQGTSSPQTATF